MTVSRVATGWLAESAVAFQLSNGRVIAVPPEDLDQLGRLCFAAWIEHRKHQLPNLTNAPGAFARKSAEAMQTGLPCRVRSFASAGSSDPGGQVLDVAAAPFRTAGSDPKEIVGNAAGQSFKSGVGPDAGETAANATHEAVTARRDEQPLLLAGE